CVDKAGEDGEKDEVDEQLTQANDHSEETPEPTVAIHYELELHTDSSQSSTEDFHKPRANEKDFSQASLSRFLPAPRHSLAIPPPLPFAISQRQKQFGGSMELSAYPNDLHPHVVDDFSLELSQHKPFFTSSSINLSTTSMVKWTLFKKKSMRLLAEPMYSAKRPIQLFMLSIVDLFPGGNGLARSVDYLKTRGYSFGLRTTELGIHRVIQFTRFCGVD
ncbi:hypothetical protein CLF_105135, partial [Clonorchis sinensis]